MWCHHPMGEIQDWVKCEKELQRSPGYLSPHFLIEHVLWLATTQHLCHGELCSQETRQNKSSLQVPSCHVFGLITQKVTNRVSNPFKLQRRCFGTVGTCKNEYFLLTFTPRIEENICVCFWISAGTKDAIWSPDCNIHAEFSHDAFGGRLDGKSHRLVFIHDNLGPPLSTLQLWHYRHWDVGALILLRVATYKEKEGMEDKKISQKSCSNSVILWLKEENAVLDAEWISFLLPRGVTVADSCNFFRAQTCHDY